MSWQHSQMTLVTDIWEVAINTQENQERNWKQNLQ